MADEPEAPEAEEDAEDVGAEEAAEVPWDGQTDAFIDDIDDTVSTKYSISLRTLLTNPEEYAETKDILDTVKKVKDEVDSYFENLMGELKTEQEELTNEMENADALYTKLDQAISSKAAVARVPYVKPVDVDTGNADVETVYLDQYNNNVDSLVTKFVNISNYIANLSTTYKKYNIGSWLFSGERSYNLSVKQPESMVITVENSRDYLDDAVQNASVIISGLVTTK